MISMHITGFDKLAKNLRTSPEILAKEMKAALGDAVAMAETESARRTPVDTGLLRSSIGGARGFKSIRNFFAEVGTNVQYALFVHEGNGRHATGERKFMEKGARAAIPFIKKRVTTAMQNLARSITK